MIWSIGDVERIDGFEKDLRENPDPLTFTVFENGLGSVGSVRVVTVAGPGLVLLFALLLLFELQVHLLLPGLRRQVGAALPLALLLRGAFRFGTVGVGLRLIVWRGTRGLLE